MNGLFSTGPFKRNLAKGVFQKRALKRVGRTDVGVSADARGAVLALEIGQVPKAFQEAQSGPKRFMLGHLESRNVSM